jgi:predicted O-methyltransferase YrrM
MIDLTKPNEWQRLDKSTGLVSPWLTFPALDEIETWDLKDKIVFEYGLGASTIWWAKKCKRIEGVETSFKWWLATCEKLRELKLSNCMLYSEGRPAEYVDSVYSDWQYDIIIIDGDPVGWRDACVKPSLECLAKGGKLICDNWHQPSVWMPLYETQKLLTSFPHKIFKQPNHPDWQTLICYT